ncbi:DUF1508 domain-containing protein [Sinomonas sp. R1AF57]|uniref:YegP family protein n=1 Tax=Sinomonas sp. R1AF57 TaxID=2020377 RepID=UPI000B5E3D20|nr:DUF1508 domain-containing protein [Sinomonas sp. R1AF57]ASN53421.1 DUF1508 domain-containing protein [Sinomonas sp. R1AF57]
MSARFEVLKDEARLYRLQLRSAEGLVIAVAQGLRSLDAVKQAIDSVRESAATGLVVVLT